jgi:hypothetical protein
MLTDTQNIRILIILQKGSGLPIFSQIVNNRQRFDEMLFTGFVQAITLFSADLSNTETDLKQIAETRGEPVRKFESLEFIHNNFNILVVDGTFIRFAAVLDNPASDSLKALIKKFIERFEARYGSNVQNWDGDINFFLDGGTSIANELFRLDYMKDYSLNPEMSADAIKNLIKPNTIASTVYNFMSTIAREQGFFKLSTITSLISEENRLDAKNVIVDLINSKAIIASGDLPPPQLTDSETIQDMVNRNKCE